MDKTERLRERAEEELQKDKEKGHIPADVTELLHELQVHQIELQMQNEELKKSQEELSSLYSQYHELYDHAPVGYFTLDKYGIISNVNIKGAELLKLNKEKIIGRGFSRFISKDMDKYYRSLANAIDTDKIQSVELQLKGNTTFYVCMEIMIVHKPEEMYRITITDITKRKKAEEKLCESEKKYRALFENAPVGIYRSTAKGKFIDANSQLARILGYDSPEDLISTVNKTSIVEKIYVDKDLRSNILESAIKTNDWVNIETQFLRKDGKIIIGALALRNIGTDNKENYLFEGFIIDITKRKNAEVELQNVLNEVSDLYNNAPCGYYSLDNDGYFVKINDTGLSWLGYSREEIIGKKKFTDLITEDGIKQFEENFPVFKERGNIYDLEYNMVRKDGSTFTVNLSATAITDSDGNYILSRAIIIDISERKKMEKKLQDTVHELERSNQELQQFAYVSSHDLQEPLRTIASFTQLLERRYKGKLDSDADEFMDYIVDAAIRMKQQINDLLEYSRVATKDKEFNLVDLNSVLSNALNNLKNSIDENNAEITYDKLPNVLGDEDQLRRVFQNLFSNAIKYRKLNEAPKIHISVQEKNNQYIFSVSDNGIGIEKQYLNRIFEIFQRLHTKDEYSGTGIGLAVVKKIIDLHGGRIWVESEFGKGSTFYFTIPVKN